VGQAPALRAVSGGKVSPSSPSIRDVFQDQVRRPVAQESGIVSGRERASSPIERRNRRRATRETRDRKTQQAIDARGKRRGAGRGSADGAGAVRMPGALGSTATVFDNCATSRRRSIRLRTHNHCKPALETALAGRHPRVGGERNDRPRDALTPQTGASPSLAVEFRHLHVHEHKIEGMNPPIQRPAP